MITPLPILHQDSAIAAHAANGLRFFAMSLIESYERFWNLKPEVNEQLLGYHGRTPEALIASMNQDYAAADARNLTHYHMANFCNQWLAVAEDPLRVPTTMPPGYVNHGTHFTYTAPVIEPAPEPMPPAP